jgi:hypothetical protein
VIAFELATIGAYGRRLDPRRAWLAELPWDEPLPQGDVELRAVWTRTAFSETASAAAFAAIAGHLLAAGAPIDLVAAAGDFVVDEVIHAECAARIAGALGGAVSLEVDLGRLVRPATSTAPLLAAAELVVRTSCVGEALTVPILGLARRHAGSRLVEAALGKIVADEAQHAKLGAYFLAWATPLLDDAARAHLGSVAGRALRDLAPAAGTCGENGLGRLDCATFDPAFARAARARVAEPLAEHGIVVPAEDLAAVGVA